MYEQNDFKNQKDVRLLLSKRTRITEIDWQHVKPEPYIILQPYVVCVKLIKADDVRQRKLMLTLSLSKSSPFLTIMLCMF